MNQNVLITGADRGLGLAMAKDFLAAGENVFAGRFLPEWYELKGLQEAYPGRLHPIPLDVSSLASIREACGLVLEYTDKLDILVNNAGISGSVGDITCLENMEAGTKVFATNCLGPLKMVNTFLPLMEREGAARRLCFVSSEAGSISVCHREEGFIYPMSKTALNMTVKLLFTELKVKGFTFRLYHPGWVRSYMSGEKSTAGKYEPEESSKAAVKLFTTPQKHEDVLKLYDIEGRVWPF